MDKQLQTYFENIIDLEKNAYTQRETIAELNSRIHALGYREDITHSTVSMMHLWSDRVFQIGAFTTIGLAIYFGIKGLFSGFISGAIGGALKGGLIGLGIGVVIAIICYIVERIQASHKQAEWDENYRSRVEKDKLRVTDELEQKARLTALRDSLSAQNKKTDQALRQYYDLGLIYPKYHNINAICSFYEYYMSGRCTQLTGHEGAYNIYESELRANLILAKLDDILANLEQIKGNQYMLYSALSEGNRKIDNLIAESERQTQLASFTAEQSAIAAYNTAEAKNELQQLKWLKTYELISKGE